MSFNPYAQNGGTILGIAGEDFCLMASDTRLCEEEFYNVLSRNYSYINELGKNSVLGATGFQGDCLTLLKKLKLKAEMYSHEHNKEITTKSLAQLISVTLYYRRFFPLFVNNILGGLDEDGKGALYSFDSIGSYERERYRTGGSSGQILQPFLDNQIGRLNQQNIDKTPLTAEKAVTLVHDVYISAAERDIHCGDNVVIKVIKKDGIKNHKFELRKD